MHNASILVPSMFLCPMCAVQELHILLTGSVMIRRLKVDILSKMPRKIRKTVSVEILDPSRKEELA